MTISCDKPRPKLRVPNQTTPQLAWTPPAYIPPTLEGMQRVLREALAGIYDELVRGQQGSSILPLVDGTIDALSGTTIQGVGDGQVIVLPQPIAGQIDTVRIILDAVVSPVTVVHPDGTSDTITAPGAYDYIAANGTTFETSAATAILGGVPTDHLLGRDTPGTGATEYIAVGGGIEFTGTGAIEVGEYSGDVVKAAGGTVLTISPDAVTNAKLADMAQATIKLRASGAGTGNPIDGTITQALDMAGSTRGALPLRGAATWGLLVPGTLDLPLCSNGAGADPTYRLLVTAGINDGAVTNGKLRDSVGLALIGRSVNSTGTPSDIGTTAGSGAVMRESSSVIGWGTIATAGIGNNAVTFAKVQQVASKTALGRSTAGTGNVEELGPGAAGECFRVNDAGTALGFFDVNTTSITDAAVTNAKLANMSEARVKGRARGAGTGVPVDLTSGQLGEIIRYAGQEDFSLAAGTFNDFVLDETTKIVRIDPSGSGDVVVTGWEMGTSNTGGSFRLCKQGTGGRVVLKHATGSSSGNQHQLPDGADYILSRQNEGVLMQNVGGRWQLSALEMPIGRLLRTTVYTAGSSTHTYTARTNTVDIEQCGAGGGSGGVQGNASAGSDGASGGGGGGGYDRGTFAVTPGGTSSYSVGGGGSGGSGATPGAGTDGGDTTTTELGISEGGGGSAGVSADGDVKASPGGAKGGSSGAGDITSDGIAGGLGWNVSGVVQAGDGGASVLSAGQRGGMLVDTGQGIAGTAPNQGYGVGASGAASSTQAVNRNGAAGRPGVVIYREYS
jgi:hypothetical protein